MTFIEKFEEIKKKIGKPDTSKLGEDFAIQITMTDEDCGGTFYVAYKDGALAIEPYDYYDNTASVRARSKDLVDVVTGKLDALSAVMTGKIEIFGNMEHIKALALIKKPAARRCAKKSTESAEKKTEKSASKKAKTK